MVPRTQQPRKAPRSHPRHAKGVSAAAPAAKSFKPDAKYASIYRDLQRQRTRLLQGAEAVLNKRPGLAAFPDMSDQATAEADQNFALRIKDREQKLLKKIDQTLERMALRTYGICERCGEEIPLKRLKARPVTTLCIECKTQQEAEERIHQSRA